MGRAWHLIGSLAILSCALALSAGPAGATGIGQNGRIAFSSGGDLYTINEDGTGLNHLVETAAFDGNLRDPSFSGDGEWIAFTSNAAGTDDIWVVDSDFASAPVRLTNDPRSESEPAWQPFGEGKIAYITDLGTAAGELWWMNSDGSAQQQLTTTSEDEREPVWSQSGTDLVFVRSQTEGGSGDLVRLTPRGGGEQLLTSGPADDRSPSWYMGKIAFTRAGERGPGSDLFQIKPDGSDLTQLTTTVSGELDPAGSPNGKRLAFVSGSQLLVGNSDATGAAVIPNAPSGVSDPDWESIFQLNISPIQKVSNVEYEEHGTFAIVSFDTKYKTALPVVELWDGSAVNTGFDLGPADDHFEIKVAGLEPDTTYDVKIVTNKPGGGTMTTDPDEDLTTLQRNVSLTFRWVRMHDDSDPGSCGDFSFYFELSAPGKAPVGDGYPGEISICDGDGWDPSDKTVTLTDVQSDAVSVLVIGGDDDDDCIVPVCLNTNGLGGGDEVSKASTSVEVTPNEYTEDGENWIAHKELYANSGDDLPHFTLHYKVQVSYS
jgi:Tol biopolymer transport system component